jgi:REP element-mobilizing transposase RayT
MIASGFSTAIREAGYIVHACSILTDHAHLVVAAGMRPPSIIERHLKSKATKELRKAGAWLIGRPVWQRQGWIRFIDEIEDLRNTIQYVFDNPEKSGLPPQNWTFVTPVA